MIRSGEKKILLQLSVLLLLVFFTALSSDAVWAEDGYSNSCRYWNANAQNYGGGHMLADYCASSTVRSFLIPCDDGRLMRVHSYEGKNTMLVEYYDQDLNLISSANKKIGLSNPGTIYTDGDYYYVVSGRTGLASSTDSEIIHIVKYDESWQKIASTGIKGYTDVKAFYDQPVRITEINGYLLIRTAIFQGGHNVSFEIILNKETMEVVGDTLAGTVNVMGFTSHCFDSYIDVDGNDVITLEVRDGQQLSGAVLTRREFDPESGNYIGSSRFDDYQGYMLKGNGTYDFAENCCGISVGGFEVSENKYIAVGTTIDLKNINTSTTRNVYLAVADRQTELEDRYTFQEHEPGNDDGQIADITMLTSYEEGSAIANTPHLVPMGNDRYLIIWSRNGPLYPADDEETNGTVYYQMIDGDGNLIGDQYSFEGILSDCKPIIYNGSILWYTRSIGRMTFYSIDVNDISKHSVKDIPLVKEHFNTEIECFTPATFTDYGYTGYPTCHDCGFDLDTNHRIKAFGSCYLTDERGEEYNTFVYTGEKITPTLSTRSDIKEGVDYKLELPDEIINVGRYSAKVTLMGNYTGSKTIKFKVLPAQPKCSIKALKRKIKINVKKPAASYGAAQFQIDYRLKGKSWKTVTTDSQQKVLKKLKKGKTYNVRVRAFIEVNGKTYNGDWYYKTVKVK